MVGCYKQVSMLKIFNIILAKKCCKTNENRACYLELTEISMPKLTCKCHFLDLAVICIFMFLGQVPSILAQTSMSIQ